MTDPKPGRLMGFNEIARVVEKVAEDQERMAEIAVQLQDDVIWIQKQLDVIQASITGLLRRPRE